MNTALIVAAGSGVRSELKESKILYQIKHKPLFMYSVDLFKSLGFDICLVVSKKDLNQVLNYVDDQVKVVIGGKTRSDSVKKGLKEITNPYVFIHDAARPLLTKESVLNIEKALEMHDAVALAEPVTSALKYYDENQLKTVDRTKHILMQTPQAFLTEKIRHAYLRNEKAYDDDVSLYQDFYPNDLVHIIKSTAPNPKMTYPVDFIELKRKLEGEDLRIGHSFDLHQLIEGKSLILGGIEIDHHKGLLGHSDADVVTHAIAESLLGAVALGDLGSHFPDTDPTYKDINSMILLEKVYDKIKKAAFEINNIDVMVYLEKPKLSPYIDQMRAKFAKVLEIDISQISIKATTYEKVDAIGAEKAIASESICLLRKVHI